MIELKPFCLRSIVWAERFFFDGKTDGFERMGRILENQEGQEVLFDTIVDIAFHLGESDFKKYSIESSDILRNKLIESEDKYKYIINFKEGIEEIFKISFPKPESKRPQFKGGKSFGDSKQEKEENWEKIYIEFYRAGGMSIDQFMNMTMIQITPLLREIQHRKNEELNIWSDLIHKKISIKKPQRKLPEMEFTKEDVDTFAKMHEQLVKQSKIN